MRQTCNRCNHTFETEGIFFKYGLCEFCLEEINDSPELEMWKNDYLKGEK